MRRSPPTANACRRVPIWRTMLHRPDRPLRQPPSKIVPTRRLLRFTNGKPATFSSPLWRADMVLEAVPRFQAHDLPHRRTARMAMSRSVMMPTSSSFSWLLERLTSAERRYAADSTACPASDGQRTLDPSWNPWKPEALHPQQM